MEGNKRSRIGMGLVLVVLGLIFLVFQLVPGLRYLFTLQFTWPLIVIGVGVFLLLMGVIIGAPGMAIPACIVGGIGGLLYWQNLTGNWESWAYAWALIPGFVGTGMILAGALGSRWRLAGEGLRLIFISAIMFLIFASFLGGANLLGPYWPVLLIVAGLLLLIRPFFRRKTE